MDLERADTFTAEYKDSGSFFDDETSSNSSSSKYANRPLPAAPIRSTFVNAIANLHVLPRRATTNQGTEDGDDGFLDEETVHWKVLVARIFAFFLLFLILLCIGLEAITRKFLILAAIICGLLVIVIVATYVDSRNRFCWCCCSSPQDENVLNQSLVSSNTTSSSSSSSTANSRPISVAVPVAEPNKVLYSGNAIRNTITTEPTKAK